MTMTLFEDGKRIGVIEEWTRTERFAEKKTVLGKEIVTRKPKDQCQFVSPKPVNWRKRLHLVAEDGTKLTLTDVRVTKVTTVTATIDDEK
ncbi:MAG: hypothetical protein V4760_09785 [Bdellovibrionota bacterium]